MTDEREERRGPSGVQRALFALFGLLFAVGVALRWWLGRGAAVHDDPVHDNTVHDEDAPVTGLVEGAPPGGGGEPAEAVPGPVEEALPFVTEASLAGLLGLAVGYASRVALKVGLIALAVLFVAIQGLSLAGVVTVDWDRALDLLNELVLNLRGTDTTTQWLSHRLPSAATFAVAFAVGFRRR